MPKNILKSKFKLKTGADLSEISDLVKLLSGDCDNTSDIDIIYNNATNFNTVLQSYMLSRFNMGKIISQAYTEAGTRLINDNQLIITPIKQYFRQSDSNSKKFIGTLDGDQNAMRNFKKNYFEFKKSKTVLDAMVICNNITNWDYNKTYNDLVSDDMNIFPFKNISEYESEKLNLKFIFMDEELTSELKASLYDYLKMLHSSTSEIHKLYNTPDIDLDELYPKIMTMLDELLGDLKGCKEAKKIIKSSSSLFSQNFTNYFRNFQVTESPFGIIEDFVNDIITNEKSNTMINPKLLTELGTIMSTIKKKINKNSSIMKNPKFAKAINMVENAIHNIGNMHSDLDPDKNSSNTEDLRKDLESVMDFLSDITGDEFAEQQENNTNA